jgi:hypothetical protein
MNLSDPRIEKLINREGLIGLGLYAILDNELRKRGEMKLSEMIDFASLYTHQDMVVKVSTLYELFFTNDNATFYPYGKKNGQFMVDDAYNLFNAPTIKGRFFTKLKNLYSLTEEHVLEEFGKWKERNAGVFFKDVRHLENSFNYWLANNKEKPVEKESVDWANI